ncbi:membrane bound O-acyl transferase family-domain-containing protein [Xylariaceae sp. FL1272]|nr:membrane bound O-acyl transferase family-domain-containing protein [Xylariaceae sp. FL1272]
MATSDLATTYRELYHAKFRADVVNGETEHFIIPLHLLVYWIVPTLYLTIPHKNRPWLYRARWVVLAFVTLFHLNMIRRVSSLNFASAYLTGLLGAWAIIWTFRLLVWTKPQWDAKRVERRRKISHAQLAGSYSLEFPVIAPANHAGEVASGPPVELEINGTHRDSDPARRPVDDPLLAYGEDVFSSALDSSSVKRRNPVPVQATELLDRRTAAELTKMAKQQEYEYFWQEYPQNGSFGTRFGWAFDLVTSFRLTGWNSAPSCLPDYRPPPTIGPIQLPLEYGSHRSTQGFQRTLSIRTLVISRLGCNIVPAYFVIDLCAAIMTMDPYFILGPGHGQRLPQHLASLHPVLLSLFRTILAFTGVIAALEMVWNIGAISIALYCPPILGFRAHPWHLPTMSGSLEQILDKGLSGFWGGWWHQTFRAGFSAPTKWLLKNGYISHDSSLGPLVGAIIAFTQSGLLHAAASYSTVPETWPLGPFAFFMLAGTGTVLQAALAHHYKNMIGQFPRWVRRLGNLVFVGLWLWATAWPLTDDFGRCGIWLWEPVPLSLARAAGIGHDQRLWRYGDADFLPFWHHRGRWWEKGIAI